MKRRDLLTVGVWALATMGVSLAATSTLPVVAVETNAPARKIEVPVLKAGAVELSARFAKDDRVTYKDDAIFVAAGSLPPVEITARNTSDTEQTVTFTVTETEQTTADFASRVMRAPSESWEYSSTITVPAGETITRNVTLKAKTAAEDKSQAVNGVSQAQVQRPAPRAVSGQLRLRSDKNAIVAASFTFGSADAAAAKLSVEVPAKVPPKVPAKASSKVSAKAARAPVQLAQRAK